MVSVDLFNNDVFSGISISIQEVACMEAFAASYGSTNVMDYRMKKIAAIIERFGEQGEKTGWTYIAIDPETAQQLKPGNKKPFRVKGSIDQFPIRQVALMPMGDGSFIMPLNAEIRKGIAKRTGATVILSICEDEERIRPDEDFLESLTHEPKAHAFFQTLTYSHQNYFNKWISSAKTVPTRAKRISMAIEAFLKGWGFPEMLRNKNGGKG